MRIVIPFVALVLANPLLDRPVHTPSCGPVSAPSEKGASR